MCEQRLESQPCEHAASANYFILRGIVAVRCPWFVEWGELESSVARCGVCVRMSVSVTCTLVLHHNRTVQPNNQLSFC